MAKITLDRETFKALASDTRLDILKNLDGRPMGLNDIAKVTNLNKATLHEHLTKLNEAGLIKRTEREGHNWVYYRLTWKGESLLHPENTRIVVLFTATFVALAVCILNIVSYIKGTLIQPVLGQTEDSTLKNYITSDGAMRSPLVSAPTPSSTPVFFQDPLFLYAAVACFTVFLVVCCIAVWRYRMNKSVKF
jgi:DNA-binding transcriptional ArsR family regulator